STNAPTLQYLRISPSRDIDFSAIIQDADGSCFEYLRLHALVVKGDYTTSDLPKRKFDGVVPFPSLRRLVNGIAYLFGDDMALFRGSAATLETLPLGLTRQLAKDLLRQNISMRTSHPKLQCVSLKQCSSVHSNCTMAYPEVLQLIESIAPNAAAR
ncbi:hypothetical protein IWW57_005366, partial [Coemansia sp. S610]